MYLVALNNQIGIPSGAGPEGGPQRARRKYKKYTLYGPPPPPARDFWIFCDNDSDCDNYDLSFVAFTQDQE